MHRGDNARGSDIVHAGSRIHHTVSPGQPSRHYRWPACEWPSPCATRRHFHSIIDFLSQSKAGGACARGKAAVLELQSRHAPCRDAAQSGGGTGIRAWVQPERVRAARWSAIAQITLPSYGCAGCRPTGTGTEADTSAHCRGHCRGRPYRPSNKVLRMPRRCTTLPRNTPCRTE